MNDFDNIFKDYVLKREKRELHKKRLYYIFIDIPKYWDVKPDGVNGAIYNEAKKMATIYFIEPKIDRIVDRIEWIDDNGTVYKKDYYNEYGVAYCSEYFKDNQRISRSYFTSDKEELINMNDSNGAVILFEAGVVKDIFSSVNDFVAYHGQNK